MNRAAVANDPDLRNNQVWPLGRLKPGVTIQQAAMTAPAPSRAAQYVRMSTEHQQYSPEIQLEIIRQYAAAHNMEIVSRWETWDISANDTY